MRLMFDEKEQGAEPAAPLPPNGNGHARAPAEPKRKGISETALARALAARFHTVLDGGRKAATAEQIRRVFAPAEPPKGAVPAGFKLAMDDAFTATVDWATGQELTGLSTEYLSSAFVEGIAWPGYSYLSQLALRAEYRTISETIATEMTRKWIVLQSTSEEDDKADKIDELNLRLEDLGAQEHFRRLAEQDGFMGRSHLYIDTGQTDDPDELKTPIGNGRDSVSKAKIEKGMLRAIRPVEAVWAYPTNYNSNNPLKGSWYNPDSWFVMSQEIHSTRFLRFVGREVPDMLKPAYSFGGLSMSQMAKPYVDNWLRTRQSVADLVHAFSVFALSTDLSTSLMADGDQLFKRVALFNNLRDNSGLMMLDKETEELNNVSAPLGTLDALQAQTQEHMAAVSRIPIVKLLGIQPAGLNASSEGEIRTFYDTIHSFQARFFTPNLKKVVWFAMLDLWGEIDPEIKFAYEPLWSLDEKGEAELRKIDAETGQIHIDAGVISPEEERTRIAKNPANPYQGLDPEDVPELKEEEEEGLVVKGAGGAEKAILEGGEEGGGKPPTNGKANGKGAGDEAVVPFGELAADDGEWNEADHPRGQPGNAGQFGSGGGGAAAPAGKGKRAQKAAFLQAAKSARRQAAGKSEAGEGFKNKKEQIGHLLTKEGGTTTEEILKATGWPSVSVPALAKANKMVLSKEKRGKQTFYTARPMTDAEIEANYPPKVKRASSKRGPAGRDPSTWTALEYIAARGGISDKDPLIGDVRSLIGSKNKFIPGFGMLIRPGGASLDDARQMMLDGQYVFDIGDLEGRTANTTISTLLDLMDNELRGNKQYRIGQRPPIDSESDDERERIKEENEAHEAEIAQHHADLDAALNEAEIPAESVQGDLRRRIISMMDHEGTEPLDAYERAVMEDTEDRAAEGEADRIPDKIADWDRPDDYIPF